MDGKATGSEQGFAMRASMSWRWGRRYARILLGVGRGNLGMTALMNVIETDGSELGRKERCVVLGCVVLWHGFACGGV